MGAPRTSDKILDYFHEHQNVQVNINELIEATGLEKAQVQNAINNLKSRYHSNIETVMTGNLWIYKSGRGDGPGSTMFELVGKSSTGVIVIQDEDGKLYKAVEIV